MATPGQKRNMVLLRNQALIADKVIVAESFLDRLRGWIGKKSLLPGEAIVFPGCKSVHTWMMSIPIDVLFLKVARVDATGAVYQVVSAHQDVRPWNIRPLLSFGADDTAELQAGIIARHQIKVGDEIWLS